MDQKPESNHPVQHASNDLAPASGVQRRAEALPGLVGRSPAMDRLAQQVERVVQTDVTVAVFGESGTGKELVARAIHEGSARSGGPFVAVNCAAIVASLQESELFGHERGAFTGALQTRRGCFELANHGTLFLDELGEMSPAAQAALLRTLQERTVRRVGGSTDVPVDVRIVCATRRDLRAEVAAGRFREDLYFRLVVYPVELPPLRARASDVPLLVDHALAQLQTEPRRVTSITPEALEALQQYAWPGNVRELFNVVQRSLLTCAGGEIGASDLPADVCPPPPSARAPACATEQAGCAGDPARCQFRGRCGEGAIPPLEELERFATERAMEIAAGSVRQAAKMLGIGRATLYRKLKTYRIPFEEAG
jgi:DNA-binding NtrC family response regulator